MLEIITFIVVFALSVIGLCDILHSIWMCLIKPAKKADSLYFVKLDGDNDYVVLNYTYERYKWYGRAFADRVIAVYDEPVERGIYQFFNSRGIEFLDSKILNSGVFDERGVERDS